MIPPHLTLVFGTSMADEQAALRLTEEVARMGSHFRLVFTERRLVDDVIDGTRKLFLLPHEGQQEITELHDQLYARLPSQELRTDIPYVPHMTVATCADATAADSAMHASSVIPLPMAAEVEHLTLVEVIDRQLCTIARLPLSR